MNVIIQLLAITKKIEYKNYTNTNLTKTVYDMKYNKSAINNSERR